MDKGINNNQFTEEQVGKWLQVENWFPTLMIDVLLPFTFNQTQMTKGQA